MRDEKLMIDGRSALADDPDHPPSEESCVTNQGGEVTLTK